MNCPSCNFEYSYEDDGYLVCSACQFRWDPETVKSPDEPRYFDAHGTELFDGDDVIVIKDLKFKGSSDVIKQGTKVTNIKLIQGDHDISCRVAGFGNINLKTEFVKKA